MPTADEYRIPGVNVSSESGLIAVSLRPGRRDALDFDARGYGTPHFTVQRTFFKSASETTPAAESAP
jgi:hypothetical protein